MTSTDDAIDLTALEGWLADHGARVVPPLEATLIAGGRSNLTYRVSDRAQGHWVLRRPPLGELLPSAHDMGREYRILAALQPTDIPVPPLVGFDDSGETSFYVMEQVEGHVVRSRDDAEKLTVQARRRAGEELVDTLARLHAVDPESVGLGDLGRTEDYAGRQLRRWYRQWTQAQTAPLPLVDELHQRLEKMVPEQQGHAIVHGDYKLDNVILRNDGTIAAVLDWELCTLGDPLADLGTLLIYSTVPPGGPLAAMPDNILARGFLDGDQLAQRYARQSGLDVSNLDFYIALAYWKLAIILEGVLARTHAGAYGTSSPEDERRLREAVERLTADAAATLD